LYEESGTSSHHYILWKNEHCKAQGGINGMKKIQKSGAKDKGSPPEGEELAGGEIWCPAPQGLDGGLFCRLL
jgi:hypothetical protein